MYAVNAVALMNASREPQHLPLWLALGEIITEQVVQTTKGVPGHDALLVRDDVSAERWQAIVTIIRTRLRKNQADGGGRSEMRTFRKIVSRTPEQRHDVNGHVLTLSCGHVVWRRGKGPETYVQCRKCRQLAVETRARLRGE